MSQKLKLSSGFELVSLDFIVSHEIVGGMCNLLGSVWSQQKFELTDVKALSTSQLSDSVTALCSWTDAVIALQQISVTVLC